MSARVLLITPQFYGIEKEIISVLQDSDYEVVWIENKTLLFDYHGTKSQLKLIRRFYYLLFSPATRFLKSEFKNIPNAKFDLIFALNAHVINHWLLKKLKKVNPDIISILYLWDCSGMYDWHNVIDWFDKVFTFDPVDSVKYEIKYKPNFYLKKDIDSDIKNDLFFIGKYNIERKSLIDKIIEQPDLKEMSFLVKLFPAYKIFPHNYFIYRNLKRINQKSLWIRKYIENFETIEGINKNLYISHEYINFDEFNKQLMASNVILDIPFETQTGYTHRVIQALANGKKVLTTNTAILKEDFYNPSQIHILDREFPEIEIEWLKEKSIFPVDKYFQNLELSVWLNSILNASIV
jgi:hypothetical protein